MTHPDPFTSNEAMDKLMSEISKADEGGGPEMYAFPSYTEGVNSFGVAYPIHETGMSLRDYIAAQTVAGCGFTDQPKGLAARAYAIADAMLEARKVKP